LSVAHNIQSLKAVFNVFAFIRFQGTIRKGSLQLWKLQVIQ